MKFSLGKLSILLLMASVILSTACSSGGGGGGATNTNATITDENAQSLAIAGTEGVKQAADNSNVSLFAKTANQSPVQKVTVLLAQQASQDPALASDISSSICPNGGNITGFDTIGQNGGTVAFNACDTGFGVINGTMTITTSTSGSVTTYTINANVTMSYLGETETINYSSTCTFNQTAGTQSCTYNSSALGINGKTYSVSNISVSGDNFSGYTVSATVTDPDNGVITITTNIPVTFNCPNSTQPGAGEISVSDGTNTMTVTFNSCSDYTVTFNGTSNTYSW